MLRCPDTFLIYINDLDSNIVSSILKFADDTKLSRTVNNDSDRAALQSDLHKLMAVSYTHLTLPTNREV